VRYPEVRSTVKYWEILNRNYRSLFWISLLHQVPTDQAKNENGVTHATVVKLSSFFDLLETCIKQPDEFPKQSW
jgi:hypothetical protein